MASKTVYQPLNPDRKEIRILHLYGNCDAASALEGHLETVSLQADPKPRYEGISYCWGEIIGTEIIRLNGIYIEVPASAVKVLRQFRPTSRARRFWIDALCINQADIKERNFQVSVMDLVYANTKRCLICLGDADATTQPVFQALKTISDEYHDQLYKATDGFQEHTPRAFRYNSNYLAALFKDCCSRDIAAFFERAWFSRVWVQQEAALAPVAICHCGRYEVPWRDVFRASRWLLQEWPNILEELRLPLDGAMFSRLGLAWMYADSTLPAVEGMPLNALLRCTQHLEATDVRDKFYSILGLASRPGGTEEFMHWFQVDYGKSVSAVLTDATLSSFVRERQLTALGSVDLVRFETRTSSKEASPSWSLQWDKSLESLYDFRGESFCCPLPLDLAMLESCAGQKFVRLRGYEVDRVSAVFTHYTKDLAEGDPNAHEELRRVLYSSSAIPALHEYLKTMGTSYLLNCLTNGRQTKSLASLSEDESDQILYNLLQMCATDADEDIEWETDSENDDKKLVDITRAVYSDATTVCVHRSLFIGCDGRVGLGQTSLRENDCIAALAGGRYLCILRPYNPPDANTNRDDGAKRKAYQFVGLAFIPGIMDGEIVKAKREVGEDLEVFEIW